MKKNIFLLIISITILFTSCNSEGDGIFFQISKEVEQITSQISELPVHQVVEVGTDLYALTGGKVWINTSSGNWSGINDGNLIYNIVEYSNELYGTLFSDFNVSDGKIAKYNGSSWIVQDTYGNDLTLFEANGTYIISKKISSGLYTTYAASNLTGPITTVDQNVTDLVSDGISNGTVDLLISSSKIFGTDFTGTLSEQSPSFSSTTPGAFKGICIDSSNIIYLSTASGQIYQSTDNTGAVFTLSGTISSDTPVSGSLEVVDIGDEFLIIGTNNGYYEMKIGTTTITATSAESDFATTYPDLSSALIYEVYQSAAGVTGKYFYLATSNGLWKRNNDGKFLKQ